MSTTARASTAARTSTSPRSGPSRSRLRGLVTALAVAPLLAAGLGTAPVASAQDVTEGRVQLGERPRLPALGDHAGDPSEGPRQSG